MKIPQPVACVFDAFGTLFNLSIPVDKIDELANGQADALLAIWRSKQLEYTWLRSLMNAYVPFDQITEEALRYGMNSLGLSDERLFEVLMPVYRQANSFEDVKPMLEGLRQAGIQTAILSNGTMEMLEAGIRHAGLEGLIDQVLSVDAVGAFKPDSKVYGMATSCFDCAADQLLFLSSNQWDIAGAGQFGLPTVWVNRYAQTAEVLPPAATYRIDGMADLLEHLNIQ